MEKRVLTVLRSGGEYGPEHVQAIQRQLWKWAPDATLTCLSDVPVNGVETVPLVQKWPGWWTKIELFRPDVPQDFLYTDLDNVILGPLDDTFWADEFTADIGFSFFRMTPGVSRRAYSRFGANPAAHMDEWSTARTDGKFGDAAFLRWTCNYKPATWPEPDVMNIVQLSVPCPWKVPPLVPRQGLKVLLCGGKRRRPWLHPAQALRTAYWCH